MHGSCLSGIWSSSSTTTDSGRFCFCYHSHDLAVLSVAEQLCTAVCLSVEYCTALLAGGCV